MGFFDLFTKSEDGSEQSKVEKVMEAAGKLTAAKVMSQMLQQVSGSKYTREIQFDLFYQIYGFRGTVEGVGTSTIVANTALAIAQAGLNVLVIDTSILAPVQDVLLKTEYSQNQEHLDKRLDWFDMPYTRQSVLHPSKIDNKISILSFYGKNRGIIDMLSTNDSTTLVEAAIEEYRRQFDVILIDICHEPTSIVMECLHASQRIIQVWNDTPHCLSNLESEINNLVTLACPLDKLRNVIYSRTCKESIANPFGNCDSLLSQYKLNKLTEFYNSEQVYLSACTESSLWYSKSSSTPIIDFNIGITDIVRYILNIPKEEEKNKGKGTITSNDIVEGKVDGTVHRKMRERGRFIATTQEEIDKLNAGEELDPTFESDFIPNPLESSNEAEPTFELPPENEIEFTPETEDGGFDSSFENELQSTADFDAQMTEQVSQPMLNEPETLFAEQVVATTSVQNEPIFTEQVTETPIAQNDAFVQEQTEPIITETTDFSFDFDTEIPNEICTPPVSDGLVEETVDIIGVETIANSTLEAEQQLDGNISIENSSNSFVEEPSANVTVETSEDFSGFDDFFGFDSVETQTEIPMQSVVNTAEPSAEEESTIPTVETEEVPTEKEVTPKPKKRDRPKKDSSAKKETTPKKRGRPAKKKDTSVIDADYTEEELQEIMKHIK